MPAFHVFVDGPVDPSPNATMQLAEAMSKRYGLPASELSSRLARGRFRVKSNVDRTTADAYLKDLTSLGARVTIEEVDTGHAPAGAYRAVRATSDPIPNTSVRASQQIPVSRSERASTPPTGVARTATPPAGVSRTATPPAGVSRTATPPAGVSRTATPPAGVSRTTPPAGVSRTATPPAGVSRTATPPAGVSRTATPPAGVSRTSQSVPVQSRTATPTAGVRTAIPLAGLAPEPDPIASPQLGRANTPTSGLAAAGAASPQLGRANTPASGLAAASGPIPRTLGTSESPPIGRANTPASGLAAAGLAASAPARPSNPTGLAAAGPSLRQSSPSIPAGSALRQSSPSIPAATEARAASTSNPPAFTSGLAAAFSSEIPLDLGALGDDQALSLASVDGVDEPAGDASFAPPGASEDVDVAMDEPMPASIGPAMAPSRPTPVPARSSQPLDLFAPPEAADDAPREFAIADERPSRPSAPPATTAPLPTSSARISQPILVQPAPTATSVPQGMPRNRFLAGVVLAIVLGFIPAHFVGASRESAAYGEIDRKVQQYQADPTVSDDEITTFRNAQLAAKQSKRTTIALTSLLVWAAVSAALAYVWFRRIPWDRVDGQSS